MTEPKLQRILAAIETRLVAVKIGGGYYTDAGQQIVRGRHSLDYTCLPGFAIYFDGRSPVEPTKANLRSEASIVIEGIAEFGADHPEDIACRLAADIQKAIESTDRTLDGLLLTDAAGGLNWQSDEFIYPDNSDNLVGVRVTYAVPHIRRPGDPLT